MTKRYQILYMHCLQLRSVPPPTRSDLQTLLLLRSLFARGPSARPSIFPMFEDVQEPLGSLTVQRVGRFHDRSGIRATFVFLRGQFALVDLGSVISERRDLVFPTDRRRLKDMVDDLFGRPIARIRSSGTVTIDRLSILDSVMNRTVSVVSVPSFVQMIEPFSLFRFQEMRLGRFLWSAQGMVRCSERVHGRRPSEDGGR
jgi:hypothetical protein